MVNREFDEQMWVWWSNVDHLIRRHTGVGRACWNCYNSKRLPDEFYGEFFYLFYCSRDNRVITHVIKQVCDWWEFRG
jgi:hypothetical protein